MYQCIYNRLKTSYTIHVLFIINKTKMISIMLDNVALFRNKNVCPLYVLVKFFVKKSISKNKNKVSYFQ
jgi:hypothetical protein